MLNKLKENKMKKLFKNTYKTFLGKVAEAHNIDLNKLIEMSNADDELRKELEQKFLATIGS
jgi:hypothetical protein